MNGFGVRWVLLVLLVLRVILPFQLRFPYSSFLFAIQFGQPPWWPISGHFPATAYSNQTHNFIFKLGKLLLLQFFFFSASLEERMIRV